MSQSTTVLAGDEFRPIPTWPYEINASGTIVRRTAPSRGTRAGKVMRFGITADVRSVGYYCVQLRDGHQGRRFYIHELVALTFLGPRPYRMVVNHKDGNHFNNDAGNLEYVTHRQNMHHSGKGFFPPGERHPNAKLRAVDVAAIKACLAAGKSNADIARFFDVNPGTIDKIWRGARRQSGA